MNEHYSIIIDIYPINLYIIYYNMEMENHSNKQYNNVKPKKWYDKLMKKKID